MNDNEQYSCVCDEGYEGNGVTCSEIILALFKTFFTMIILAEKNPCSRECQSNSECKLDSGKYNCVCDEGFYLGSEKETCCMP